MSQTPKVAILMGSESDLPVLEGAVAVLEEFGVPFEMHVVSAHRSPNRAQELAAGAEERGLRVLIAAAGGAAHLAGVVAAHTVLPVIGVPIPTDCAGGMDSLLSTVQMPGGVPVACMGLGKSGAKNAAVMAVRILAGEDEPLRGALKDYAAGMSRKVGAQDRNVQKWLSERRMG
jgi:phosphoribosylaminoimidazole carboxylase PurE protein